MIKPKKAVEGILPYSTPKYAQICNLKLDSNENPYGASKEVLYALKELTNAQISRYPHYGELVDKLAQKFNLKDDEILPTNGADEALSVIINTYLDTDEELLCFMPTFSMPKLYATSCHGKFRSIDYYTKWVFDADKLIENIDAKTKIIYITSPNNPTGELANIQDIEKILSNFPQIIVLLDVTYINFAQNPPDYYSLIKKYENIFIVKSFSKDMGLAGLRLGCALSQSQNIEQCKKIISPYSVNAAALYAGLATLDDVEWEKFIKEQINTSRNALIEGLNELGFKPYKSQGNFILCDFNQYCDFIEWKLQSKGIKVRSFKTSDILKNCLRITTPKVQDLNLFFDALITKDMLVFDLDGVVFDVSNSYRLAIKETFKHFSQKELQDDEIQKAKELGGLNCDWDLTKYLLDKHGFNVELEKVIDVFQKMFFDPQKEGSKGIIDNEKLVISPETFEKLSEKYDFCAFTGRPRSEAIYSLEKFGILKYFCKIISQDDIQKNERKPHPEGLNRIKRETIYNKIYYFGDTVDDIYSAVASTTQVYGVAKKSSKSALILTEAGAQDIIEDMSKLDEFLKAKENTYANS